MNTFLILATGYLQLTKVFLLASSLLLYSRKQRKNDECLALSPSFLPVVLYDLEFFSSNPKIHFNH